MPTDLHTRLPVCYVLSCHFDAVDEAFEYIVSRLTKNSVDAYPETDDFGDAS